MSAQSAPLPSGKTASDGTSSVLPVEGPAPVAQHDGLATEACTDACGSQGAGELVEGNDAPAADGLAAPHYRSPLLEETLRQALPMVHKGRPMPIVSAKSWVVLDATSKGVVWGSQHNEPRTIASLTKIVTASVVVGLSKQKPSILNEIVEVSNVASRTIGTSAKLCTGDRVAVKDLLHGLMLPSGNDAAQALAEHFGKRMLSAEVARESEDSAESQDELRKTSVRAFCDKMEEHARSCGARCTVFANPHGLDAAEGQPQRSTASDVARIAACALREPLLAKIVNTKKYTCTLWRRPKSADGVSRSLLPELSPVARRAADAEVASVAAPASETDGCKVATEQTPAIADNGGSEGGRPPLLPHSVARLSAAEVAAPGARSGRGGGFKARRARHVRRQKRYSELKARAAAKRGTSGEPSRSESAPPDSSSAGASDPLSHVASPCRRSLTFPGLEATEVTWINSHKLLGSHAGFDGVKTGITQRSGPCLCSSVRQDGKHYIVVLLSCRSRDERYTETLKLARWMRRHGATASRSACRPPLKPKRTLQSAARLSTAYQRVSKKAVASPAAGGR